MPNTQPMLDDEHMAVSDAAPPRLLRPICWHCLDRMSLAVIGFAEDNPDETDHEVLWRCGSCNRVYDRETLEIVGSLSARNEMYFYSNYEGREVYEGNEEVLSAQGWSVDPSELVEVDRNTERRTISRVPRGRGNLPIAEGTDGEVPSNRLQEHLFSTVGLGLSATWSTPLREEVNGSGESAAEQEVPPAAEVERNNAPQRAINHIRYSLTSDQWNLYLNGGHTIVCNPDGTTSVERVPEQTSATNSYYTGTTA